MSRRVVVIGGGVTGLATAWHLADRHDVVLLEASDRLGGQVATVPFAGTSVDLGADALLAVRPEAVRLARALGLGDDLVAPAASQVYLWSRGRLRRLPEDTVLGAPTDPRALLGSGALGPLGALRAAAEPLLPRRRVAGDRSVADLVGERFGREVVDVLVEPLLGGVYAGSAARLSAAAAAAPLWEAAASHRSVTVGLRAQRTAGGGRRGPVFLTVRGGLGRLVDALAAPLRDRILLETPATRLEADAAGWIVHTGEGPHPADDVVVAVPSAAAAALLAEVVPDAARELLGIRRASVAVVALAYEKGAAARVPDDGSGVLVPRGEGRLVKAMTWTSRKWPHHAEHARFLVRASIGRVDDPRGLDLADEELALRADAEVRWASRITAPAVERRVVRWPDALPQYDVGHRERVDRIRAAVGGRPGLHVGGAMLDGIGLAARVGDAERLAAAVATRAAPTT